MKTTKNVSVLVWIFLVKASLLPAQSKDDNVVITNSLISYLFEKEKERVLVKEKKETYYECTQKRTAIPIVEFYNDQTNLDKINGKSRIAVPQYRQYDSDVAFEDGIAAFKPSDAQETLRKKYGDFCTQSVIIRKM